MPTLSKSDSKNWRQEKTIVFAQLDNHLLCFMKTHFQSDCSETRAPLRLRMLSDLARISAVASTFTPSHNFPLDRCVLDSG